MKSARMVVGALLAIASATACGLVLGIEDPQALPAMPADAETDAAADADLGVDAQVRAVDPSQIFVSARTGNAETTCGTMAAPCRTIGDGIARYREAAGAKTTVYLASGSYAETVHLADGVIVEGGWDVVFGEWVPSEGTRAVVVPADARALVADDLKIAATVRFLTLRSKAASPSESLYGVFARGSEASAKPMLHLDRIAIELGPGGDGDAGMSSTEAGAPGLSGCVQEGDGGPGGPGMTGTSAGPGVLTSDGYSPSSGDAGGPGTQGENGQKGEPSVPENCTVCCGPGSCGTTCSGSGCSFQQGTGTGTGGDPGCGGSGGAGGAGGNGGGASIGVFAWGADIVLLNSRVVAGAGGRGGEAGEGAPGGDGGLGLEGAVGICGVDEFCRVKLTNAKGFPGENGGSGGAGGAGGSGAGGASCAIYTGFGANVALTAVTLIHGPAGASTSGAPGIAKEMCP